MSHLGRHRNDLATWRAYAASVAETVAELAGAWDGWQPRELDLGGGYAAPRDPNTWIHGGDVDAAARARDRGRRRGARERPARRARRSRAAGRRRARDRAGPRAARRHRHPPHARRQPQGSSASRSRGAGSRPTRPRCSCSTCSSSTAASRSSPPTRMGEPPAEPVDVVGCSCGFDVLAPQVRLPAVGDRRHARVPRHGRLRGRLRGQLQRAAAAGDRPRQRHRGRDRAPRRDDRGRLRARRHPGAAAAVTVRGIDHAGITVASVEAALGLLPRPARPARDRRGRGRGAGARRDHRA